MDEKVEPILDFSPGDFFNFCSNGLCGEKLELIFDLSELFLTNFSSVDFFIIFL